MPTIENAVERHVMIDIETLDNTTNSFITSIGMVEFFKLNTGEYALGGSVRRALDPWAPQPGSSISANTLEWRQHQSEKSKQDLRRGSHAYTALQDALLAVNDFIRDTNSYIWANSPSFDCTIIKNAMARNGIAPAWGFWQERDVRTIKFLQDRVSKNDVVRPDNDHDPIEDCTNQITYVVIPFLEFLDAQRAAISDASEGGHSGSKP